MTVNALNFISLNIQIGSSLIIRNYEKSMFILITYITCLSAADVKPDYGSRKKKRKASAVYGKKTKAICVSSIIE